MRFSASSLPLLVDCAHSAKPGVFLEKDKPNAAMYVGNAVHRLAESRLTESGTIVDLACQVEGVRPEDYDRVTRLWVSLDEWLTTHADVSAKPEVAYAYNPVTETSRVLGFGIGRKYRENGQRDDELAGTADMIVVTHDKLHIYDWKTGRSVAESYRWQLRLLGLAAARAKRSELCTGVVIHVVRVGETEVDDSWSETLDASDLDDVAAEVLRVWREAPTAIAKPGGWCEEKYCRARKQCDAYQAWRAA